MAQRRASTSPTKAEEAFTTIRQRIARGELPGGAKLTLQALSTDLRMSLTPVREALRVLQAHGLVEYRPHHGHVVTRYSLRRAEEVYLLRTTLEPIAVELAAERMTDDRLAEIRSLHEEFCAVANREGVGHGAVVDLNALWHRKIYEAADTVYLEDFVDRLWTGMPYQAIWSVERRHESVTDHEAVMAALGDRHGELAAAAMRTHILRSQRATISHLRDIGAPER
ncbi:GntR family transcriptional regulator [Spiractinospora alimapuensis]|uniref:GntR family transcriptional regulator n=1 Tax=Spiractinospora alimapuensis TaxID=2820884 RepID=UPI001F2C77FD|nr:GntR family transcriptional regulator [Spiractinospora alimapuensis]QVQ52228.1 GntR family transcriptional regulator [Spiractinospora alimapuensis]